MRVTQEKLPASQVGLEIEISSEMSKQAYENALQKLTRTANIPGFRKGKVPRQILIQRFGTANIKASVIEDLIQEALKQAIDQEKVQAIGQPQLRSSFDELLQQFEPGTPLTFSIAVDVPPEAKLNQYKGLTVQAEEIKADPERVDNVLEDYRKRAATLVPVEDRPSQTGDLATVDFAGQTVVEGEEPQDIPGGSATDFEIELTEGKFIPGFIEGIVGMGVGETKEISVPFPEEYPQEDLAGKPAVFTITLKELKERELPDLDDDFAQDVSEYETLAELRQSLSDRYEKEAIDRTKSNKQEALLDELVKYVEVELPESMIRQEVDYSITQTAMQLSQQGMDIKKMFTSEIVSMLREQARPEAIKRLHRTLALGEVVKQESLEVSESEIAAKTQEMLEQYSKEDIDVQRLQEVVAEDLLKDKILDWLEQNNSIELVEEGTLTKDAAPESDEAAEAEVAEVAAAAVAAAAAETAATPEAAAAVVEVAAQPVAVAAEEEAETEDEAEDEADSETAVSTDKSAQSSALGEDSTAKKGSKTSAKSPKSSSK